MVAQVLFAGTFLQKDTCFFLRLMECYGYGQAEGLGHFLGSAGRGCLLGCALGARTPQRVGGPRLAQQASVLGRPANA
jgi:hypothetical protein